MMSKFIYLLLVAVIAVVVCSLSGIYPPISDITLSNLISEFVVTVIVLIAVLLVNNHTSSNSKHRLVKIGLTLLFISLLADTMDEIRAVSDLYSLLLEDIPEMIGYLILLIGIISWFKHDASYKTQLAELAKIDPLTNALNRRAFRDILIKELARSERSNHFLSLAMIDIDNFKDINDLHGHAFGDYILKKFSDIISGNIRQSDVFCRWGGEEFIILLPETTADEAFFIIDKLRVLIETSIFTLNDMTETTTFSAGIASYPHFTDIETLIKTADDALYQAKSKGRNNTILLGK